jgi:hypothetical protein
MFKKLPLLLLILCCFGCDKVKQQSACGTQLCSLSFASIGIKFTDKNGNSIAVTNYSVVNKRTKLKLVNPVSPSIDTVFGYYIVATDSMRDQLSAEGDEILISATNPATGQTKTTVYKISGGCNCHVDKISGVETIAFD